MGKRGCNLSVLLLGSVSLLHFRIHCSIFDEIEIEIRNSKSFNYNQLIHFILYTVTLPTEHQFIIFPSTGFEFDH